MSANLETFYSHLRRIYTFGCISNLLDWDQKVTMPPEGGGDRAEQLELISTIMHEHLTAPTFLGLVDELGGRLDSLNEIDRVNVRETKRQLDRARKLPVEFVARRTRVSTISYQVWAEARAKNDWKAVAPHLKQIVALCREEAELLGYDEHPYDALFDGYEPGGRIAVVKPLLLRLGDALAKMLPTITERFRSAPEVQGDFPEDLQAKFDMKLAAACGYNFNRGRLDATHHPFQTTIGSRDFRITTHYYREDYLSSVYSVLHEAGHALYEAGLLEQHKGTPMGSAISLGIHESQSRLWENLIGRSQPFCNFIHRSLEEFFPSEHRKTSPEIIWRRANRVAPSLIRIEADEVTYSLHIIVRMLLEEQLMSGELGVDELPEAWNALYEKYLGLRPDDYADGVMQDVHWYGGSIGYFPTYALGNLYGAMMLRVIERDLPGVWNDVEHGNGAPILNWLQKNVHERGMKYKGPELIREITGEDLSEVPFVKYIEKKFLR